MRVPFAHLHEVLRRALTTAGLAAERADLCARLIAETSRDGVYSHGLNRFPRFLETIRNGVVDVQARATRVLACGAIERWDGNRGPGNLNAWDCMERAIALSRQHGVGCVALANTNHWMRGGTYGWQSAEAGVIGLCWTNTLPNLPPWGARAPAIGNNPLVIAVPRAAGHVVLDMAMSQFSVGALESYRTRGEELPVAGGFDRDGVLTRDPAALGASGRLLPIGFWKGSGLAIMLDLAAATLAGGRATWEIPATPERETDLSQVFLTFDVQALGDGAAAKRTVEDVIHHLHASAADGESVRHPGERTLETRRRNLEEGIPVDDTVWQFVMDAMRGPHG
jgi:3-dehydro-L-gulonate 2-dehydrogenase